MKHSVFVIRSNRYLRRSHLCEIADNADRWDYNRQLCSKAVRRLPKDRHLAYPVMQTLLHEHRHMEPCEPHMRLVIDIQGDTAFADVPLDYFDKLPKSYSVFKGERGILLVLLDEKGEPVDIYADSGSPDLHGAVKYFRKHCQEPKVIKFVDDQLESLVGY